MSETTPGADYMHPLSPHLVVDGAAAAIDFYVVAFGAEEVLRLPGPDGKLAHVCVLINGSSVLLVDQFEDMGAIAPTTLGGSPVTIHLIVADVDAAVERAVAAGATVAMPVENQFWGDRYGVIRDPFGAVADQQASRPAGVGHHPEAVARPHEPGCVEADRHGLGQPIEIAELAGREGGPEAALVGVRGGERPDVRPSAGGSGRARPACRRRPACSSPERVGSSRRARERARCLRARAGRAAHARARRRSLRARPRRRSSVRA